jgi:hypothetical protein
MPIRETKEFQMARIALCRAYIAFWRLAREPLFYEASAARGSEAVGLVIVGITVLLGDLEGKPMNASKIAAYLNLPRSTVRDKLARLLTLKVIVRSGGNSYVAAPKIRALTRERSARIIKILSGLVADVTPALAKSATKRG